MYHISLDLVPFQDENLSEKLAIADEMGINIIELCDTFDGKKVWELSGDEIEDIRNALIDHHKRIVLISTSLPLNRIEDYKKLFRAIHLLNVEHIKLPLPQDEIEINYWREIAKISDHYGIQPLFENKAHSMAEDDESMTSFFKKVKEFQTGVIYNPLEFVKMGRHPFFHMFYTSKLKNYISFMRLNDGLYSSLEPKHLCEGNGEIKELISILLCRSYPGYFSLTPYLNKSIGALKETHEELKAILKSI